MNVQSTLSREGVLLPPGARSRRIAMLMFFCAAAAAAAGVGLFALAVSFLSGLGGERNVELFIGGVVLPLLSLFFAGVAMLAFRNGRERLQRRQRIYYPGF